VLFNLTVLFSMNGLLREFVKTRHFTDLLLMLFNMFTFNITAVPFLALFLKTMPNVECFGNIY